MGLRAARLAAVLALAAALLSGSASAKPPWAKDFASISRGLNRAVAAGRIDAGVADEYRATAARAAAIFAMLDFNTRWFASHWDQRAGTDLVDYEDGAWYRAFPGLGFQFHPLENFGKLNNFVTQHKDEQAAQLAQALLDRSVVRSDGLAWEYYFRFGGGRPPW